MNVIAVPAPPAIAATTVTTAPRNAWVSVTVFAPVGSVVVLYDGGIVIGTLTVVAAGTVTFFVRFGWTGNHTLSATQSPAVGVTSAASASWVIRVS
jgi:hypothetical protein